LTAKKLKGPDHESNPFNQSKPPLYRGKELHNGTIKPCEEEGYGHNHNPPEGLLDQIPA
jgi:hypothetical protein